jgi:hypothetical protein
MCVFTLLALPLAWRALSHLDVNLFNQASDSLVRFRLMRQFADDFGGDILAAVVSIPDKHTDADVKELKAFGVLLRDELAKLGLSAEDAQRVPGNLQAQLPAETPWLRQVECRTGQGIERAVKKIVRDRPFVVLTPADVEQLKKLFEPAALKESLGRVRSTLEDLPANSAERIKLQEDPLGISELASSALKSRLARQQQAFAANDPDGFFLSPDGTTLVILARAVLPANKLDFNRVLMAGAQRAENHAITAFRATNPTLTTALKGSTYGQLADGQTLGSLQAGFTGQPAVFVENEMSLKFDMVLNTVTSLLGVLILFAIAFRSLLLTWDVAWAISLVILWTVAFAGLAKGSISLLGAAFTAVPVGLGTDYMILQYNTFHRLRNEEGLSVEQAMSQALMRCGPSILTAAAITAIAFFGMGFTHLTGLAEFGTLGGASALLGCAMMLIVYPAALCRSSRRKVNEALPLLIPAWGRLLERRSVKIASVLATVILVIAGIILVRTGTPAGEETVAGVKFDSELGNLRSLKIQAIPLRDRIFSRFHLGLTDLRVVVAAADEARAFDGCAEVNRRLRPFIDKGELSSNGSVLDFVPSAQAQQASLTALKTFDIEAATNTFKAAANECFGERGLVFFKPFLKRMQDFGLLTRESSPLTLAATMQGPLGTMLAPYVKLDEQSGPRAVRLASMWFPKNTAMPQQWYENVVSALETNPPPGIEIHATAARMVGFELKESTLRDCTFITAAVGLCVALSLVLAFRSLGSCLLASIPLLLAYVTLLAAVPISQKLGWDFSLNFVNLMVFPLLLGSAIDYGVYMVFEASSKRRPGSAELLSHTGRSVFYCMGTTLIGFGSFVTSSYTGLVSLGVASLWGYAGALFGALVTVPAILGLLSRREEVANTDMKRDAAPAVQMAEQQAQP